MLDAQNTPALPAVTRREAYQPPDWHIPELALDFDLDPAETRVRATLSVMRAGAHDRPLRLDGAGQVPLSVTVDGVAINDWRLEGETPVVPLDGRRQDRKTVVSGKSVSVRVDRGGRRFITKKK